jgi:hypothetical protein
LASGPQLHDLIRQRFELLTHMLGHDIGGLWRPLNDRQIRSEFENGATVWRPR